MLTPEQIARNTLNTYSPHESIETLLIAAVVADRAQRVEEPEASPSAGDLVTIDIPPTGHLTGVVGFTGPGGITVFGHGMSVQGSAQPYQILARAGSQEARTFARRLIERGAFLPAIVREALLAQIGD